MSQRGVGLAGPISSHDGSSTAPARVRVCVCVCVPVWRSADQRTNASPSEGPGDSAGFFELTVSEATRGLEAHTLIDVPSSCFCTPALLWFKEGFLDFQKDRNSVFS